jgi:hypothetical protein
MFYIVNTGDYYDEPAPDANQGLPDLKAACAVVCRQRYRRIDRFIQLALIGSGRCTEDRSPAPDSGLYVGSGFGTLADTINVHEQIIRDHAVPRPADFVNTLSNSAGYYVANNLQLDGPNIAVSRGDASFEAALAMACADLEYHTISEALVGSVDECSVPAAQQAQRMSLAADTAIAEGSHWLTLARDKPDRPLGILEELRTLYDNNELNEWLTNTDQDNSLYYPNQLLRQSDWSDAGLSLFTSDRAAYPSHMAGVALQFLRGGHGERLITLNMDPAGRIHVMRLAVTH